MSWNKMISLALLGAAFLVPRAWAQPSGGFAAVLDKNSNFGDSRRSVVFYDIDDMSAPLFGVFVGAEAGGFEDPTSFTVDPANGDVYVLSYDSGDPQNPTVEIEDDGDPDGEGDYDLVHIDFASAYNHWEANFAGAGTYVTYGDGGAFDASHTNPQAAPVISTKIGEIARTNGTGDFFEAHLEFLNQDTLLYVDAAQTMDDGTGLLLPVTDVQYRSIQRVNGAASLTQSPSGAEGGTNNNTAQSWESTIIGEVQLDGAMDTSEPIDIAVVQRDGVTGLWVMDDDGDGEDIGFFEITNLDGTAGNAYRMMDFGVGPVDRFELDNNPSVDDAENLGNGDGMLVDPTTGDLIFVEGGFFDAVQHQPTVFKLAIDSYDSAGMIDPGAFSANTVLDLTGIYSDSTNPVDLIDGRNAIFDWVNNDIYFFDEDNSSDTANGGVGFNHDWYKLDLDTGVTTAVGPDADESNGLFNVGGVPGDQVLFFNLDSTPTLECDFNGDEVCDLDDLDILYDDIAADAGAGVTDLDGDGMVTNNDIDDFLTAAGAENGKTYYAGDVDFDGDVDGPDFTQFAANFGASGLPGAYWGDGNFNGEDPDGVFRIGGPDFTGLAANFGMTSVSAVPEPGSLVLVLFGMVALLGGNRRR